MGVERALLTGEYLLRGDLGILSRLFIAEVAVRALEKAFLRCNKVDEGWIVGECSVALFDFDKSGNEF
mgnify:FL=1